MSSPEYYLESYTLNPVTGEYTRVGEIITFSGLSWNKKTNNVSECSFNLNVYDKANSLVIPYKNFIAVWRNNMPEFFGCVVDVSGNLSSPTGEVSIQCYDLLYELTQRYSEGYFVRQNTDAGLIASDIINLAQNKTNGNLGIVVNTTETVGNTNETLFYQSLGQALINQSDNIIGYDFEFRPILDANKKIDSIEFNLYKSLGVDRSKTLAPLEVGHSVNVLDFAIKQEIYNKLYNIGTGTGEAVEVTESESLSSQQSFHLREAVIKNSNVSVRSTLQKKGDEYINNTQGIQLEVRFELTTNQTPYYPQFNLYDTLAANIEIGQTIFNYNGTVKIIELEFSFDENNNKETVKPVVEYTV